MSKKDKDILEELFRNRLQHLEADPDPDDWERIASRLPEQKGKVIRQPLHHRLRYWAAAAAVALMLVTGTLFVTQNHAPDRQITETIHQETEKIEKQVHEEYTPAIEPTPQPETPAVASMQQPPVSRTAATRQATTLPNEAEQMNIQPFSAQTETGSQETVSQTDEIIITDQTITKEPLISDKNPSFIADAATVNQTTTRHRKWGFGMGGGSITAGSDNMVNGLALRSSSAYATIDKEENEEINLINAPADNKGPKTNIKHKTPVSVGFSVSRYLNDRFSLQSGLTYSMVTSDWDQNTEPYYYRTRQRLHFIGIPLSVSYKIAEWQRLQVYASAGAMTQLNVSGKRIIKKYSEEELLETKDENERMKRLLWSLNARAGVSYPVIRYVSAFAEVGGAYYFDNGSEIETIYSDKPFNVSFNFGLRLNF